MMCGPKASGKSTFGRVLLNHLLTFPVLKPDDPHQIGVFADTVCWLDIDPGQPEFSPPGQVSLVQIRKPVFGPPFSHPYADASTPIRMVRAHSIAATSPKDDPEHFLACALDLLEHYQAVLKIYPSCHLIINCPGWILGSALEIMTHLMRTTEMTDVVYMSGEGMPEIVDVLAKAAGNATFSRLPSTFYTIPTRTAADFRAMQYMSYFHQAEPTHDSLRWTVTTFTEKPPLVLKYGSEMADFLGVLSLGEHPTDEFLAAVLEGSLVAFVAVENEQVALDLHMKVAHSANEGIPYWAPGRSGLTPPPDPKKTHMVALALIIRIDVETQELVVRTPLSEVDIQLVVRGRFNSGLSKMMLVRGNYDTPSWAYQEELYRSAGSKRSARGGTAAGEQKVEEDLSIDETAVTVVQEDEEETEPVNVPWVRKLLPGESIGKRWRTRKDFQRPTPRRRHG